MNNTLAAGVRRIIKNTVIKSLDEIKVAYNFLTSFDHRVGKNLNFSSYRKLNLPIWYHDFSEVGLPTSFYRDGGYNQSQKDKAPILFDLIREASSLVKQQKLTMKDEISLVDLFCADAYYSIYSLHHNLATYAAAIDCQDKSGEGSVRANVLEQANFVSKLLGLENRLLPINQDVLSYEGNFDICLCFGGLHHISNPHELLKRITTQTGHALIIQTIITSNQGETVPFFITPSPGWSWGCRFNATYLTSILHELGWQIIRQDIRVMETNPSPWDNFSISILCVKA